MRYPSFSFNRLSLVATLLPIFLGLGSLLASNSSYALDLDWSGQFRSEANWIFGYGLGGATNATNPNSGYTIPGTGQSDANFQSLFLRLRPKVIVNDNISIKSELWAGDPIYGFFGSAKPAASATDQLQYYSNQSRGGNFSAQRVYAEFLSDIGTVVVGRAPLHWGLGMMWNSQSDNLWDRYPTTGDTFRLVSKLGAFTFIPSFIVYSRGDAVMESGGAHEYSIALKYENPEEDFEAGVNLVRRLVSDGYESPLTNGQGGATLLTWDLYGRKRWGKLNVGIEVPIQSGDVSGASASLVAGALEADWKATDHFEINLRGGFAPGQPSSAGNPSTYNAFFFHPDYRLGLILFNYQLANFASDNNTGAPQGSPFDAPITNAKYITAGAKYSLEKWDFRGKMIFALADQTARAGQKFMNSWTREMVDNVSGVDQESYMGTELDLGVSFKWDDALTFHADGGWFIPGQFYAFSNNPALTNPTSSALAASLRVGVNF
jgi:hypothetical protein